MNIILQQTSGRDSYVDAVKYLYHMASIGRGERGVAYIIRLFGGKFKMGKDYEDLYRSQTQT